VNTNLQSKQSTKWYAISLTEQVNKSIIWHN